MKINLSDLKEWHKSLCKIGDCLECERNISAALDLGSLAQKIRQIIKSFDESDDDNDDDYKEESEPAKLTSQEMFEKMKSILKGLHELKEG